MLFKISMKNVQLPLSLHLLFHYRSTTLKKAEQYLFHVQGTKETFPVRLYSRNCL